MIFSLLIYPFILDIRECLKKFMNNLCKRLYLHSYRKFYVIYAVSKSYTIHKTMNIIKNFIFFLDILIRLNNKTQFYYNASTLSHVVGK